MMISSLCLLSLYLSQKIDVVNAFSTVPLTGRSVVAASPVAGAPIKFDLSPPMMTATAQDGGSDPVMRQFEKKEASLQKQREKVEAQLKKFDNSLEDLRSKKQEYGAGRQMDQATSFTESTLRSAVKAFLWRVIAGSVTFITTLRFSGSVSTALKVVAGDFGSKMMTMFIGERLMNKSQAGRKSGSDAAGRSLAKALIWRLFAICNTLVLAIFVAKDISIASKIASTDAVFKTALMFVYERVWADVKWGKEYLIEFSI